MADDAAAPPPERPTHSAPAAGGAPAKAPLLAGRLAAPGRLLAAARERLTGAKPQRSAIARIASAVTVPVFCWVFYTTSSGMIDIMRRDSSDPVGVVGAFVGTSAILVMLAAASMSLGTDLAALIGRRTFVGERIALKTAVTTAVYLFVFSMSAFFSFTYYYTNIFRLSSKRIVSEMQPMELAADVVLAAGKAIDANYETQSAQILASPGMQGYLASLDALLRAAREQEPRFREGVRKIQDEIDETAAKEAARAASLAQDARAASQLAEEAASKVSALERAIADLDAIISAKQGEIDALGSKARQEDQLALDAANGLDGLGASCGPNCESHRAAAAAARKRVASIRQTLAQPQEERATARRQRDALATQSATLRQKADRGGAGPASSAPAPTPAPDFVSAIRRLGDLRNDIRANPRWAPLKEAQAHCAQLLTTARRSGMALAGVEPGFDCQPASEARDLLSARDDILRGRAAFAEKCALDGAIRDQMQAIAARIRAAPDSEKDAATKGLAEAKQAVDACVVAGRPAGLLEADVQTLLSRSDQFSRAHTLERNRFEQAREAFFSFTPDATMAIGVAIAQDAFMFVMKLLSEIFSREARVRDKPPLPAPMDVVDDDKDDPDVRMMKALLRLSRPLSGDCSAFDTTAPQVADLPDHVRSNLVALLNRLVRERIAYLDRRGAHVLDNRTLASVEARLAAAIERSRMRRSDWFEPSGQVRRDAGGSRLRRRAPLAGYIAVPDSGEDDAPVALAQ